MAARARMLVQQGGRVSYDAAYQHKMPTQRPNDRTAQQPIMLEQQENGGIYGAPTQHKMTSPTRNEVRDQQLLRSMQSISRREQMRSPPPPVQVGCLIHFCDNCNFDSVINPELLIEFRRSLNGYY